MASAGWSAGGSPDLSKNCMRSARHDISLKSGQTKAPASRRRLNILQIVSVWITPNLKSADVFNNLLAAALSAAGFVSQLHFLVVALCHKPSLVKSP